MVSNHKGINVLVKDISEGGFSFVYNEKLSTQAGDPVRLVFNDTKKELRFNLQGRIVRMVELDETKVLYGCRLIIKNASLSKYIADKQREQLSIELKKRQELKTETVDRLNEAFHKK